MAFTQGDLDRIDKAIASGTAKVRYADGSEITYRTMDELRAARRHVEGQLVTPRTCVQQVVF